VRVRDRLGYVPHGRMRVVLSFRHNQIIATNRLLSPRYL
jgi:hypothetical protein